MYKVFIENRSIIFTDKKLNDVNIHLINAESIDQIYPELLLIFTQISVKEQVVVYSVRIESEFKRLFENFKKITAGGGIVKRKNQILFIKRNGFWDIPKGMIESNETIKEGSIREIEEECGIKQIEINGLINITYHTYTYLGKLTLKKTYWYAFDYFGDEKVFPQAEEGITEVKWFDIDKLNEILDNTYCSIVEVIDVYMSIKR